MSFPCAVTHDLNEYQKKVDDEAEFESAVESQLKYWSQYTISEIEKHMPDKFKTTWEELLWSMACAEVERQRNEWQGEPY